MPSALQEKIERDQKIIAFLKGYKDGVNVKPKPKQTTTEYEQGYVKGRAAAGVHLNEWLAAQKLASVPYENVVNFLIRA